MADGVKETEGNDENGDNKKRRLEGVRRRLDFGGENSSSPPEASENLLANEDNARQFFKKQTEDATAKWNYDFENDMPLEGDWEWEKVEEGHHLDYKELTTENKVKNDEEYRSV